MYMKEEEFPYWSTHTENMAFISIALQNTQLGMNDCLFYSQDNVGPICDRLCKVWEQKAGICFLSVVPFSNCV